MELSSKSEYAIHGLYYLSTQPDRVTYVSEIARSQNVSESYLAKIFQALARKGLVDSFRGTSGGYLLARKPKEITLRDVVEAVEGTSPVFNCSVFKSSCSFGIECLIVDKFKVAEEKMFEALEDVTLQGIVDELEGEPIKLTAKRTQTGAHTH